MPLLEYKCTRCNEIFEELVKTSEQTVKCPFCGGDTVRNYNGKIYTATGQTTHKCTGDCKNCSGCGR